jgi:Family of unknown function (DUF6788)
VANHTDVESDPRRSRYRMSKDLSALTERQLYALRERLAAGVHDPALTLRGALHSDLRQCSNERCRCRQGELHGPYTYLSVYGQGRSRTVYVPQALAPVTAEHVEATRRGEALMVELSQVNLELLKRRALR